MTFVIYRPRLCRLAMSAAIVTVVFAMGVLVVGHPTPAAASSSVSTVNSPLVQPVSSDPLSSQPTSSTSIQYGTEVETDTFSWGSTVVSAFQVGRNGTGGAQAIGWATSTNSGQSWSHGLLPGLTTSSPSPGTYPIVVNQSVGYDAKHHTWVIPSVTYVATGTSFHEKALLVNTSADALTWTKATTAVSTNVDKAWVTCDNTPASPHYGNCYVAYSQIDSSDALAVVSSSDGGKTWTSPVLVPSATQGAPTLGYNTNPVVRPDGTVVIVATDATKNGANGSVLFSSVSTDGGATFSIPSTVTTIQYHAPAGNIRAKNKPSVDIDSQGTVYAAWSDCRFETGCGADDIVYATSSDGTTWSTPERVGPGAASGTDEIIPGFAVAPGTSGATAQLSVVYYSYADPNVTGTCSSCLLGARYTTTYDGGATWSAPYTINATPVQLGWLPSSGGAMVGDYESVSFCHGSAIAVVSLATSAPTNGVFHQREWALTLPVGWGGSVQGSQLVASSSRSVAYSATTAVSAVLTDPWTGRALARAQVMLQSRAGSATMFHTIDSLTSSATGRVSQRVTPHVNTQYRWSYAGTANQHAALSATRTLTVTQVVKAHVTAHRVQRSKPVKIYGTVAPTQSRGSVVLQQRRHGGWSTLAVHATIHRQKLPNGHRARGFVLRYSSHHAGAVVLRVERAATPANGAGYSAPITLSVS